MSKYIWCCCRFHSFTPFTDSLIQYFSGWCCQAVGWSDRRVKSIVPLKSSHTAHSSRCRWRFKRLGAVTAAENTSALTSGCVNLLNPAKTHSACFSEDCIGRWTCPCEWMICFKVLPLSCGVTFGIVWNIKYNLNMDMFVMSGCQCIRPSVICRCRSFLFFGWTIPIRTIHCFHATNLHVTRLLGLFCVLANSPVLSHGKGRM